MIIIVNYIYDKQETFTIRVLSESPFYDAKLTICQLISSIEPRKCTNTILIPLSK
jgi:hypothetical protein